MTYDLTEQEAMILIEALDAIRPRIENEADAALCIQRRSTTAQVAIARGMVFDGLYERLDRMHRAMRAERQERLSEETAAEDIRESER